MEYHFEKYLRSCFELMNEAKIAFDKEDYKKVKLLLKKQESEIKNAEVNVAEFLRNVQVYPLSLGLIGKALDKGDIDTAERELDRTLRFSRELARKVN